MAKSKKSKKVTTTVTTTTTTTTEFVGLKTRIAILLDSSGSMSSIQREAVDMFNEQVRAIKKGAAEMDTKVTLVTFASQANPPLFFNTDVGNLKELDYNQYVPEGGTAMYDAIGRTIDQLKSLPEANESTTSFLMVIISDGQENASREFNAHNIAERVKGLQGTDRWTFSYLGANQDLTKVSQQLGFHAGNMMSFAANGQGVVNASTSNANATSNYMTTRSMGVGAVMDFYEVDQQPGQGGAGTLQGQGAQGAGGTGQVGSSTSGIVSSTKATVK